MDLDDIFLFCHCVCGEKEMIHHENGQWFRFEAQDAPTRVAKPRSLPSVTPEGQRRWQQANKEIP